MKKGGRDFGTLTNEEKELLISYGFTNDDLEQLTTLNNELQLGLKELNNIKYVPEDRFFIFLRNLHDKMVQEEITENRQNGIILNDEEIHQLKQNKAEQLTIDILNDATNIGTELLEQNNEINNSLGGKRRRKSNKRRKTNKRRKSNKRRKTNRRRRH
jgi:hypothetical protein